MSRRKQGSVAWHLPTADGSFQKRAFATTPQATADLIKDLALEGFTWSELQDAILFDTEAQEVARRFIEAGFGETRAALHLTPPSPEG